MSVKYTKEEKAFAAAKGINLPSARQRMSYTFIRVHKDVNKRLKAYCAANDKIVTKVLSRIIGDYLDAQENKK